MNSNYVWTGSQMSVFYWQMVECSDGTVQKLPYYSPYCGLQSIEFDGAAKVCQYCGHEYQGVECPGCAARMSNERRFHAGKAVAHFAGLMPQSEWLTNPPQEIDICIRECGRPDSMSNADSIIRLRNCKLVKSEIEFSSNPWIDDCEVVVTSLISCDVEIYHRGEE